MQEPKSFVKNAADKKQVKAARQKEKFGREQELRDIAFVLSYPQGRRLIWRYLGIAGIDKASFNGDANWCLFYEGQRNVGLKLKADIVESDPKALITMMIEARNKEANEQEPQPKERENG